MPKDPPVGRWGTVIDGIPGQPKEAEPLHAGGQIRCNGCRGWFMAHNHECPACGHSRPGFNKWIRTAQLNNHLYAAQAHADLQKRKLI